MSNTQKITPAEESWQMDGVISDGTEQFLTFELNGENYGVEILRVQEIRGWDKTTPIPQSPPYLCGVLNLRGAIVPIVDLRLFFEMPFKSYSSTTVVIVLKLEGDAQRTVGVVVDAVSDAEDIALKDIKATPNLGSAVNTKYIKGIANVDDELLMLLDIDKLLSLESILS
ncbi:MAG: purine-binding chemotaxis protein CheW [Methylophaga sp.]|nr:purine-binding chemotaxis protein CheW [Methylophaga sp.]